MIESKKVVAEYIWIDANNGLRSKTKCLSFELDINVDLNKLIDHFPEWNFDGSSTGQATTENSEVILKPVAVKNDLVRGNFSNIKVNSEEYVTPCYLVLCDTYFRDDVGNLTPHKSNSRHLAKTIFNKNHSLNPMFGLELEFFIEHDENILAWSMYGKPAPQGKYYCGVGSQNAIGREFVEYVLQTCINSDIPITGLNAEVAPSQWEFQVCDYGINACDNFIFLRYILERLAEFYEYTIDYHPKPKEGWNGSGCHVNFSTEPMRSPGGIEQIMKAIEKLGDNHEDHMKLYGCKNELRLTGKYETADYNSFSWGVGDRSKSIRIPTTTNKNGHGYLEDRRPASNIDPYIVCSTIFKTCCL